MSTLEHEIATALTSDAITGAELQTLVTKAHAAIADADAEAKREESRVYDPQLAPDPQAAKAAMENALLASGRLQTLLTRLTRKRESVEAEERFVAWETEFGQLKVARNALANELVAVYPDLTAKLIDLFSRIVVCDGKIGELHRARPSGVSAHLAGVELEARQMESFSRDRPPLLNRVVLVDLASGKQSWPVVVRRDLSHVIPVIDDIRHSPDWWKEDVRAAREAEQKADHDRLAAYYEKQAAEREKREKQEHATAASK